MAATPVLVQTVRQRQQARAQATAWAPTASTWIPKFGDSGGGANMSISMPAPAGVGSSFMRTEPSLAMQITAARSGATGLAGPTFQSMAGAASETSAWGGTASNYATVKALSQGGGQNAAWARQELRRIGAEIAERKRQRTLAAIRAEQARRRGDSEGYSSAKSDLERYERWVAAERARNEARRRRPNDVYGATFTASPDDSGQPFDYDAIQW